MSLPLICGLSVPRDSAWQSRYRFAATTATSLVAIAILFADSVRRGQAAESGTFPNIVFILADDLGYGDVGVYNPDSKIPTPHLDRLAAQGMRFTDAHSPASVCSPTRYSVLTGRYAWRTRLKLGVLRQHDPALIAADRLTVGEMLQQHGYATAAFGKWHLGWTWPYLDNQVPQVDNWAEHKRQIDFSAPIQDGPLTRGFDYFFGMVGNTPSDTGLVEDDRTIFSGQGAAPAMAGIPGSLLDNWRDENTMPMLAHKVVWYLQQQANAGARKPFFVYYAMTAPHNPILPHPDFRGKTGHGEYCDYVHELDWCVGRVTEALERTGLAENTLLVFSSDNGSPCYADMGSPTFSIQAKYGHNPSRPWRGMKADIWEGGHRVPLIVRWPGHIRAATTNDQTVCLINFFATSAAIVGHQLPNDAAEDSYDILPTLLGQQAQGLIREATIHHSLTGVFGIRQGEWKLILGRGSGGFSPPQTEYPGPGEPSGQLYNLAHDPSEKSNLFAQRPEIVRQLTALLHDYQNAGRSAPRH